MECDLDRGDREAELLRDPDLARDGEALFLDFEGCVETPRPPTDDPEGEVLSDIMDCCFTECCSSIVCFTYKNVLILIRFVDMKD